MSPFLIAFFVVDALIMTIVVLVVARRRAASDAPSSGGTVNPFDDAALAPSKAPAATIEAHSLPDPTGSFLQRFGGGQFRGLGKFAREQHDRIGSYVRTNWSGSQDQLPGVLGGLLSELDKEAQSRGLSFDRETLKSMLAVSLRSHDLGGADVLGALERVA